ncbi:hypothetical protein Bbelb_025000 [Branchiostoma belcheri]|nr:hypothetical protein Bbelb_025000 [Branchiostoma belcheri]
MVKLHNSDKPWITPRIKHLIKLRQRKFTSGSSAVMSKFYRNKVQREIRRAKNKFYTIDVEGRKKDNPRSWHNGLKAICNMNKTASRIYAPDVDQNDHTAIANAINAKFANVSQSLTPLELSSLPSFLPTQPLPTIQVWDVYSHLLSTNTYKSPGPDGIPARILKDFACELSSPLCDLFNTSLAEGTVPRQWKEGNVVPLPKSSPPNIDELRPISLTPMLSKLCERFVTNWIVQDISPGLDPRQFGARKRRSTTHALVNMVDFLYKSTSLTSSICTLVTTDLSKAFDKVDHTIAIRSLLDAGVRPTVIPWICSFMTNRWQRVSNQGATSDCLNLTCGVALKRCGVSTPDLTTVYTMYVRPTLEYAVPVWHPALTCKQSKTLERIQPGSWESGCGHRRVIVRVQETNRPDQRTDVHPSRLSAVSRLKVVPWHGYAARGSPPQRGLFHSAECSLGYSRLDGPVYHSPAQGLSLAAVRRLTQYHRPTTQEELGTTSNDWCPDKTNICSRDYLRLKARHRRTNVETYNFQETYVGLYTARTPEWFISGPCAGLHTPSVRVAHTWKCRKSCLVRTEEYVSHPALLKNGRSPIIDEVAFFPRRRGSFYCADDAGISTDEEEAEVFQTYRGRQGRPRGTTSGSGRHPGHSQQQQYGGAHARNGQRSAPKESGHLNPKTRYGDYLRCHCCGSFRHLVQKCPDAHMQEAHVTANNAETGDDQFAVLFTGASKCLMSELSTEASLCAVLDSACSSTVCGVAWLKQYLSALSDKDQKYVKQEASSNVFKFGGGEKLSSLGKYSIPAKLAGKDVLIVTDVVDSDIPLLLSLDAMKKANIVLHTRDDRATIFGRSVNLNLTTSGHYCAPLEVSEVLQVDLGEDHGAVKKKLVHLHRQFAHPTVEKLTQLLQGANSWRSDYASILQEIAQSCDVCKRFKRGPARPVAALPKSTKFNQVVAMDLKNWGSQYLLYFVDEFSRLTVAKRISRKHPKEVVDAFMELWLACGYGIPEQIMVDNGGAFTAEEIMEFTSRMNIKVNSTAGHSPFSNGVCERNHAVMDVMLEKLVYENTKTPIDQLIEWACTAKNAMGMFAGYSPYQIVFGRNPVLPGFETHPPSTNDIKGDVLLNHLTALAAARRAFTEAESSERVRRALRRTIRISERQYAPNDQVYYKRDDSSEWFGPAKVIAQDGKIVFLRHGAYMIRVHINSIVLYGQEYETETRVEEVNSIRKDQDTHTGTDSQPSSTHGRDDTGQTGGQVLWKRTEDGRLHSVQNARKLTADNTGSRFPGLTPDVVCVNKDNVVLHSKVIDDSTQKARNEGLQKLKDFETFDVNNDTGQERISTRWVDTITEVSAGG